MRPSMLLLFGLAPALAGAVLSPAPAQAGELLVRVAGLADGSGEVGCALFSAEAGFPMDNRGARQLWLPADVQG